MLNNGTPDDGLLAGKIALSCSWVGAIDGPWPLTLPGLGN